MNEEDSKMSFKLLKALRKSGISAKTAAPRQDYKFHSLVFPVTYIAALKGASSISSYDKRLSKLIIFDPPPIK